jgi:peptidyl-prolyl cis-trans isomerase C
MLLLFALFLALPQEYVNLIMDGKYQDAVGYCDAMIQKNKDPYQWKLEKGDIYYAKLLDYNKAIEIYQDAVDNYKQKDGWAYYRLAQVLEMNEDFLTSAKMYEIVATRFRKAPLDSFSLTGVERCFKKNYQDYVATVDNYNITRLELDEKTGRGGQFGRSDERAVLDQMIMERLIYENAVKYDVKSGVFFQDNYRTRSKLLLLDEVRAVEVMQKATPTEKQMQKFYKNKKENYKIREQVIGKEIVVESDSLARVLLDSLKKDIASFDTLAKQYSVESTARSGGNMGVIYRDRKPKPVEDVIFKIGTDKLSDIIAYDGKYGIYYITSYKPEQYRQFDEVKKQIEAQVRNENIQREDEALTNRLRKTAKINIYNDSIMACIKDTTEVSKSIVVANINNRAITWADVNLRNETMNPQLAKVDLADASKVEELINTIIDEELRIELAWRKKYFLYDGYFVQLKDAIKMIMDQALYTKIVIDAIVVDTQAVTAFYKEHIEEFKVPESARMDEIALNSKEEAVKVRAFVTAHPEAFDSVAKVNAVGESLLRGKEGGLIMRGMLEPAYDKVLFNMKVGEISNVFSVNDKKWSIIKMIEHNPEHYRTLEEMRPMIESRLQREQQANIANTFLTKIKEEANIQIFLPEPEEKTEQETEKKE